MGFAWQADDDLNAQTNPAVFFATCARLIGPEVELTIEQTLPSNLSMEAWQVMREIVAAVSQYDLSVE